MKIEIEYNGSVAKCIVNGKPINICNRDEQNMAFSAFQTIKKHIDRENETYVPIVELTNFKPND